MDPGTAGLGLNFAAEGRFKAGEAASILGTTSAVMTLANPAAIVYVLGHFTEKSEKSSQEKSEEKFPDMASDVLWSLPTRKRQSWKIFGALHKKVPEKYGKSSTEESGEKFPEKS